MGTKADCKRGWHTSDNQGLCHWCGELVNADWYEHYAGRPHPAVSAIVDSALVTAGQFGDPTAFLKRLQLAITAEMNEAAKGDWK